MGPQKTVFEYTSYKHCVNDWVRSHSKRGYGIYSRMAAFLDTNSAIISQVFKGDRELSLEQAAKLCRFMGLGTLESDYFLLLVQRDRAGSHDLKEIFARQLGEIRARGQAIKNRIEHEQISDQDKAMFYSSWCFIATWLAAPISRYSSMESLAAHFQVPEKALSEALRFLLDKGLLVKKGNGYDFGVNVIHVPHDSPFVLKHHANWRIKALQAMDQKREENLFYTAPMSMSREMRATIRERLVQFIQKQTKEVAASPSEELVCLNIDYFCF